MSYFFRSDNHIPRNVDGLLEWIRCIDGNSFTGCIVRTTYTWRKQQPQHHSSARWWREARAEPQAHRAQKAQPRRGLISCMLQAYNYLPRSSLMGLHRTRLQRSQELNSRTEHVKIRYSIESAPRRYPHAPSPMKWLAFHCKSS
ncbi:unnamed protein product [Ectocarpus sp. 4 AP-2014]